VRRSIVGPVSAPDPAIDDLTVLGRPTRGPADHVECFEAPAGCTGVRFSSDEVTSLCPVTGQPDISTVVIDYRPDRWCIESKSLKLYLWSFRDRKAFCEAMAVQIADEVMRSAEPHGVTVTVTQHVRGGIVTEATAERGHTGA
jgi:7-cyano-7-deazaguanine reductase